MNVKQVVNVLNHIAPLDYAENWDNCGLQIGNLYSPVKKIWTALDPGFDTIKNACKKKVDLLITHHPLFLKTISSINTNKTNGKIIDLALKNNLNIFSIHTCFDNAIGGVNDILADKINLKNIKILKEKNNGYFYKLVIYTPLYSQKHILRTLLSSGAGHINTYSHCSFKNTGLGTYLPRKRSNPSIGKHGLISEIPEVRIESIVNKNKIKKTINKLFKVHPYETVVYDIYKTVDNTIGIGRIGTLSKDITLNKFIKKIKSIFKLDIVKISGNINNVIKNVAICSGSASTALDSFFSSNAQVYISGDVKYHAAYEAKNRNLSIIDIGHFYSEHIAMTTLAKRLRKILPKDISISTSKFESDVFEFV